MFFSGPYIRIIQMNQSGKVVKKKKTVFQDGTKEPVFNETLNFDVSYNQVLIDFDVSYNQVLIDYDISYKQVLIGFDVSYNQVLIDFDVSYNQVLILLSYVKYSLFKTLPRFGCLRLFSNKC
jgi:hypothetical protein